MKTSVWADICAGIIAWFAVNFKWLIPVSLGMTAKLVIDGRKQKLTWQQKVGKLVIAFFCGFITASYCWSHGMEHTANWAGPLATIAGEGMLVWVSDNAPKFARFLAKKVGMKDEDLEEKPPVG